MYACKLMSWDKFATEVRHMRNASLPANKSRLLYEWIEVLLQQKCWTASIYSQNLNAKPHSTNEVLLMRVSTGHRQHGQPSMACSDFCSMPCTSARRQSTVLWQPVLCEVSWLHSSEQQVILAASPPENVCAEDVSAFDNAARASKFSGLIS